MAYTGPSAGPQSQQMLGRYRIIREIARSNDIVWEGIDPQVNRRVAVKELALDATLTGLARRQRIERFYREARAAGAMNHPNVVTIYEVGEERGRYFIAMEFLDGQTLRERLSVGGAMPLNEAVNVMAALCDALHYAHQQGVIHRDIKPDNIFLVRPDNRVKVADFGIARITHETQLTAAGQIFGTPSYMSPEQVLGKEIDARSDIFSLGIVLYEMVTGRKPFMGDSVVTITYRIMHEPTPAVLGASPALDSVIQRATAKNPADRYSSASEFRNALLTAAEQYRHTGTASLNNMPLGPLPVGPGGAAPATAMYGASTQQNLGGSVSAPLINGPIYDVAQLVGPGPTSHPPIPPLLSQMPPPVEQRNYTRMIGLLAVLAVFVVGGGWAFTTALSRATGQTRASVSSGDYDKCAKLYQSKAYAEAAPCFRQIHQSPNSSKDLAAKARQGEVWCYVNLGQIAQSKGDNKEAADWFTRAIQLNPQDEQALKGLRQTQQTTASGGNNVPPVDNSNSVTPPSSNTTLASDNRSGSSGFSPYQGETTESHQRTNIEREAWGQGRLQEAETLLRYDPPRLQDACRVFDEIKEKCAGTRAWQQADNLIKQYGCEKLRDPNAILNEALPQTRNGGL